MIYKYVHIDILYKLYNIRKFINNDPTKTDILNSDFKRLTCDDFSNTKEECKKLMQYLKLDNYILVYANGIADNYNVLKNIDSEIDLYIEKHKTENEKTLLLLDVNSYTIGHIDIYDDNTNAYYRIKNNITKSKCNSTYINSGVTYLSGDDSCVNYNYVWYSGKMWRVTAVYPDETIKLITEDPITTLNYGNNYNFYTNENQKSYVYQWLNEDFLRTLTTYQKLLLLPNNNNQRWNAGNANNNGKSFDSNEYVTSYVGLINDVEYCYSHINIDNNCNNQRISSNSFLEKNFGKQKPFSYTLHPGIAESNGRGIRPMIYLKPGVSFSSGIGTFENPFTIFGDLPEGKTGERINTRLSGEYVKLSNSDTNTYRIVSLEESIGNKITKIVGNYYVDTLKKGISNGIYFGEGNNGSYWDKFLNNNFILTSYDDLLTEGPYYTGRANESGYYKDAICIDSNPRIRVDTCTKTQEKMLKVGSLRFGEMFAANITSYYLNKNGVNSGDIWLITSHDKNKNYKYIQYNGYINIDASNQTKYIRPTLYLKASVSIASGSGTPNDPYILKS